MLINRVTIILLVIFLGIQISQSQSRFKKGAEEKFDNFKYEGDLLFDDEEYFQAAREYQEALRFHPNHPYVMYRLAECYRSFYDYDYAEYWYKKTWQSSGNIQFPLNQFWLGLMEKTNGKYIEAELSLNSFIRNFKPTSEDDKIKLKEAIFEYKGCLFAIDLIKNNESTINLKILPAPVNSKSTDYAPMVFYHDSSIVITSSRADSRGTEQNLANGEMRSDNFRFDKIGEHWVRSHNDDNFDIVNTPMDDGAGELTHDHSKYYYTVCDPECAIYVSKKVNGKFSKPVKLNDNINMSGYWNAQPTISPTTDTMFFVSKRPGGKGQHDIWMSINLDKSGEHEHWGPAINMEKINTPYIEISPFWDDHTNTIYFASNGHVGFGGLDVYVAGGQKRDSIVNMGLPFNSNRDDFYFVTGKKMGYIVSNRKGGMGHNDIYTFDLFFRERQDSIARTLLVSNKNAKTNTDISESSIIQSGVKSAELYNKDELVIDCNPKGLQSVSLVNKQMWETSKNKPAFIIAQDASISNTGYKDTMTAIIHENQQNLLDPKSTVLINYNIHPPINLISNYLVIKGIENNVVVSISNVSKIGKKSIPGREPAFKINTASVKSKSLKQDTTSLIVKSSAYIVKDSSIKTEINKFTEKSAIGFTVAKIGDRKTGSYLNEMINPNTLNGNAHQMKVYVNTFIGTKYYIELCRSWADASFDYLSPKSVSSFYQLLIWETGDKNTDNNNKPEAVVSKFNYYAWLPKRAKRKFSEECSFCTDGECSVCQSS